MDRHTWCHQLECVLTAKNIVGDEKMNAKSANPTRRLGSGSSSADGAGVASLEDIVAACNDVRGGGAVQVACSCSLPTIARKRPVPTLAPKM
jgi:hypothetical protein